MYSHSAALLESLGDLKTWNGAYEEGSVYLENALQFHHSVKCAKGIASIQYKQAALLYHQYSFKESLKLSSSSLEGFRNLDHEVGVANASFWVGSGFLRQGKYADAMAYLKDALGVFQRHKDNISVVRCLGRMAEIHRSQSHYEEAVTMGQEAMRLAIRWGDRMGEADAKRVLGGIYFDQGDIAKAAKHVSGGLEIACQIGWQAESINGFYQLGDIETQRGEYEVAERSYGQSLTLAEKCGVRLDLAQALMRLVDHILEQEGLIEEREAVKKRRNVQHRISSLNAGAAWAASDLARLLKHRGKTKRALFWFKAAITEHRTLQNMAALSECLYDSATILAEMGQNDEAALYFEASLIIEGELETSLETSLSQKGLGFMPMTWMTWERPWWMEMEGSRLEPVRESPIMFCDVRSAVRRVPQLTTPNLKLRICP
ncbi:hypothetical protein FRC01_003738 [Tulasnella sp. 417]|nr:hypothetical protein FRC01_003738 [Tulasnella sp. 417]